MALRLAPLLLVPILLIASTFPGEFRVSPSYWVLSGAAAVVFAFGWRWPVPTSLALSALAVPLFAAQAWGLSGLVPYLGALAVADVAARSDRDAAIAAVAACWFIALVLGTWLDGQTPLWTAANGVTIVASIGLPVLFGLYLRGQARLGELHRAAAESAVRSEERSAMARELHDLVAHHMASIVLRVGVARHVLGGGDPRMVAVLDDVYRTAADALADTRRLQTALRDPGLQEVAMIEPDALWKEIDAAVERARAADFTVATHIDRDTLGLDAIARLTLLRVTQEALTNVMKHADPACPVELTIGRRDGGVGIRVSSTGTRTASPNAEGHGIIGMTERLDRIGGRLDIRRTERGWEVEAWLPQSGC